MTNDRLRCIAEVNRLYGPRHRIFDMSGGGLLIGTDVGGLIIGVGLSVKSGGYRALLAALRTEEVRRRRDEAHVWLHAAFDAAVQGFDVREPCRQLQGWIEHGSEESDG